MWLAHKQNEMTSRCEMFWQECTAQKNNRINRLTMTSHLCCRLTETHEVSTEISCNICHKKSPRMCLKDTSTFHMVSLIPVMTCESENISERHLHMCRMWHACDCTIIDVVILVSKRTLCACVCSYNGDIIQIKSWVLSAYSFGLNLSRTVNFIPRQLI